MLQPRDFGSTVSAALPSAACPERIDTLMLNVRMRCNLACAHCHHACSPTRTESMSRETMLDALALAEVLQPSLIDITGGEPELYEHLRELVTRARAAGSRCASAPTSSRSRHPRRAAASLLRRQRRGAARLAAGSLRPCRRRAARWRSRVGDRSIDVLHRLAELGYGTGEHLVLDLAYNPPLGETFVAARQRSRTSSAARWNRSAYASTRFCRFPTCRLVATESGSGARRVLGYLDELTGAFNPTIADASTAATDSRSRGTARCGTATSTWAPGCAPPPDR